MATKDKITSVRQPVPSTNVLEERLDRSEKNLRDSLSKVPSALDSTEEFLIKEAIKSIKKIPKSLSQTVWPYLIVRFIQGTCKRVKN